MTDIGFDDRQVRRPSRATSTSNPDGQNGAAGKKMIDDRLLATIARTIQFEIVPRLLMVTRAQGPAAPDVPSADTVSAAEIDDFIQAIMFQDIHVAMAQINGLRARGLVSATIFLDLLAPTARQLGDLWLRDQCSFADVTIGLVRLQQIMRTMSPPPVHHAHPFERQPRALLMPYANEQHTLGLSVVKEMFLEAGWQVELVSVEHMGQARELLGAEWFDLVGVSLSNDDLLAPLTSAISAMRRGSQNRSIGVLVGGSAFNGRPDRCVLVGADGAPEDGREAVRLAGNLVGMDMSSSAGSS
ncbi:cobalamin B12-binding domain-containing protein [Phreatobacter sp.]|uniref:cobalamin B12-binding domain-containing protein n=1 Tax=Phreatobacter sp. TaxID=1966341 RepID=UPI003F70B9C2